MIAPVGMARAGNNTLCGETKLRERWDGGSPAVRQGLCFDAKPVAKCTRCAYNGGLVDTGI